MPVVPTGIFSLPLFYLRASISESPTFQTWTESANAEEALEHIFPVATESPDFPLCLIDWADNFKRGIVAGGSRNFFKQTGDLTMIFQNAVDPVHGEADATYDFLNNVGAIISEMEAFAGQAGYLDIQSFALESGPTRPKIEEMESTGRDYFQIVFNVEYMGG